MASVNKVIIVGNCGRDPEIRYLPSGQAVANISVATTSKRKDKSSGETIEDTQWHRVTFYDKLAEIVGQYVKKGAPIYVEGRLKYGTYTDKATGVEKPTCDILANEMQLLGGRDQSAQPQQKPAVKQVPAKAAPVESDFSDMSDDVPFISCAFGHDILSSKAKRMRKYDF